MDKSDWQGDQGRVWAREWRRTDRSFGSLTERLLARLRGKSFDALLDVGCGAGELALAIARGHPQARITGLDVSPQLVASARERGVNLANARFVCADAAAWPGEAGFSPELLMSRHGVMFFPDPVAAFANLARLGAPDAELVFSCFGDPSENLFLSEIDRLLPASPVFPGADPAPLDPSARGAALPAGGYAPGPFAFADPDRVAAILGAAGWMDPGFERVEFAMIVGAGPSPVEDAVDYLSTIGPAARIVSALSSEARARFDIALREFAASRSEGGIVALPAVAWLVSARKG